MMPPPITMNELYDLRNKKNGNKTIIYDKLLEKCHKRMRVAANNSGLNCFFEIPAFTIGMPLYNVDDCTNYIVDSLRRTGFLVQVLPRYRGIIYISWDPVEVCNIGVHGNFSKIPAIQNMQKPSSSLSPIIPKVPHPLHPLQVPSLQVPSKYIL